MIGTLVNTAAVMGGGIIGLLLKKSMPERVTTIYFQSIGLFTWAIGASMDIDMEHILIVVSSLAIGSLLGEWWDLEKGAERVSDALKSRFRIGSEKFTEGLVTSFLLFCVGSMTSSGPYKKAPGIARLLYSITHGFSLPSCWLGFQDGVVFRGALFVFQAALTSCSLAVISLPTASYWN